MARKRRTKEDQAVGVGMTAKQRRRKKPINADLMREIEPLTDNQENLYRCYKNNQNIDKQIREIRAKTVYNIGESA